MLDKDQLRQILKQIKAPIFENLDEAEVFAIFNSGDIIDCHPGDQIIGKDDSDKTIFILLAGSMEIRDGDLLIRQVDPGETIGELAFLLSAQRTVDIFAGQEGAQMLSLDESSLRNRLHASLHPEALLLLNLSKILAQKLAKVTRNLRKTQNQMVHQAKLASLGKLTTGIAHELKNPLNFITNFSGLNNDMVQELLDMLSDPDPDSKDDFRETLELIQINTVKTSAHGNRANTIVENMLALAGQSRGKQFRVAVNSLVEKFVAKTQKTLQSTHPELNLTIKITLDSSVGEIFISPQDIERVLLNVMNNAVDAVLERKQVIESVYKPEISILTKSENEYVEIHVKDNGMGIAQDVQNNIFDPFFTTKSAPGNSGLGLSICYDIITQGHNGNIVIQSKAGKGATFIIRLPIQ